MIWLHIGTKKTGSTALQRYMAQHTDHLSTHGVTYAKPRGKVSCNALAVAINKNRADERARLARVLTEQLKAATSDRCLISSELFYGMHPEALFSCLPILRDAPLTVLVYLRRQDRYLESSYVQKVKNGRFTGSIKDYLARFDGSGADYWSVLKPWRELSNVTLRPRICEPSRLEGGDVVSDACHLLDLPPPATDRPTANPSPSFARLQLLREVAKVPQIDVRSVQRQMLRDAPQGPTAKAVFFDPAARDAVIARYAEGNEALRKRFFPSQSQLFDAEGLGAAAPQAAQDAFSETQLYEINALLRALAPDPGTDR